jgi:hypothetical protein
MNKFMNQLIHDFMYENVSKYSWHILNIVKKAEDKLYVRVASGISDKTADCTIHIYPNGDLDDSDTAAYNFVLCIRDDEGYNAGTTVGLLEHVSDAAHVFDCLLAASGFYEDE